MDFFQTKQNNGNYKEIRSFKESNFLIDCIHNTSLLESKLISYALATAEFKEGRMIATISMGEIKNTLNEVCDNHIYSRLKNAAYRLSGHKIFTEDAARKAFSIVNIIGRADFGNSTFTIKFEPDLTEYIMDLKTNYTVLDIKTLMSLNNVYAYRLYEILKSKAYNSEVDGSGNYEISFGVSELKLLLGIIDVSSEKVGKELKKPSPDYDYIVNTVSKSKTYARWDNLCSKVLIPAVNEISDKTDLSLSFDTIKMGYGGKTVAVTFNFKKKPMCPENSYTGSDFELGNMIDELIEYFDVPLKINDAKTLLAAANYDVSIIKDIYDLSLKQKRIDNLIAWMVTAIKNNYIKK